MYQGASNHEELHNLMKATVMIRRLKKDVLSQLPVKRRQQVDFRLNYCPWIAHAKGCLCGITEIYVCIFMLKGIAYVIF